MKINLTPTNRMKRLKRNVYINDKRTSLSIHSYLWEDVERAAREEGLTIDEVCELISDNKPESASMSDAIRYTMWETMNSRTAAKPKTTKTKGQAAEMVMPFPSYFFRALELLRRTQF